MLAETDSSIDAPIDEELAARAANVRRWWRRAIVAVVFVAIVSPALSLVIWRIHLVSLRAENASYPANAAGPPDRIVKMWHQDYLRSEGHDHRGIKFFQLLSWLHNMAMRNSRTCSEAELTFY